MYFEYGEKEVNYLKKKDPKLRKIIQQVGFLERKIQPDPFIGLLQSIVSQQLSGKAADSIWNKLIKYLRRATPKTILAATEEELRACGLSFRKISYIQGIAEAAMSKKSMSKNFIYFPMKK